jgi:hypothetical protein
VILTNCRYRQIDMLEVYPHDDYTIGSAFVEVDNYFTLYINGQQHGSGTGGGGPLMYNDWDKTDAFNYQASCDEPTVYAIHGMDGETTPGEAGAGMVAQFNHCGEIVQTDSRWRCTAMDLSHGQEPPEAWMSENFDDSTWQVAVSYGSAGDASNYWYKAMGRAPDEIGPEAQWIWTTDGKDSDGFTGSSLHPGSSHDNVFCRYVSKHEVSNCKAAADRYNQDYGTGVCHGGGSFKRDCDAFTHFKENGQKIGRVWHSELCSEDCSYSTAPFNWIDASHGTRLSLGDDDKASVDLPFPFPFYGQLKRNVQVSSNDFGLLCCRLCVQCSLSGLSQHLQQCVRHLWVNPVLFQFQTVLQTL